MTTYLPPHVLEGIERYGLIHPDKSYESPHLERRVAESCVVVEATDFEHLAIWSDYHPSYIRDKQYIELPGHIKQWEQENPGAFLEIGKVDGRPITLSLYWDLILGCRVMYWRVTSQLADYEMAEKWIEERKSPTARTYDAMNFHNAMLDIKTHGKTNAHSPKNCLIGWDRRVAECAVEEGILR